MFTHNQMILQERVRDFLERELLPLVEEDEKNHFFRPELVKKMGQEGFFACTVPKEYGGNGWGFIGLALIAKEIGRISSSYRPIMTFQGAGCAHGLIQFGSEQQKNDIVPLLVSGESIVFVAVTTLCVGLPPK